MGSVLAASSPSESSVSACATAIMLAGERPGGDPFAAAMGVPVKALIPVGGTWPLNAISG